MPNAREIEIIFPVAVQVGGGRYAGKAWPTGFSWENVRALLRRSERNQPRFSTRSLSISRGKTVETCTKRRPPDGANEHRLEAYATLFSSLSSDLLEPSLELSPCTSSDDATAT